MAKNKNRLDYQANLSRHPHDISAGYSASLAPSYIVPQYFDVAQPGDAYYFNTRMFCRLQDTVTAFLGEIDVHVDYFFVPLQMIFTPFGQTFAQTDDLLTSLYKDMSKRDWFPTCRVDSAVFGTPSSIIDGERECQGKQYFRLLDALNLNPLVVLGSSSVPSELKPLGPFMASPYISPWIPAAYQAIYQKYFRNDEVEKLRVDAYNIDQQYNNRLFVSNLLFRLRRCQRPADYFTKTRVSPISSAVNSLGTVTSADSVYKVGSLSALMGRVNTWLSPSSGYYGDPGTVATDAESLVPGLGGFYTSTESSPSFDLTSAYGNNFQQNTAAGIRTLFALDKFLRIYGRAGKTYDDQILAHFGVKIPHDVKHDITHIKHYHFVMQSDPIYGTANIQASDDSSSLVSSLGQVGGQCQGALDTLDAQPEKFVAPVHGVFMAVAYAVTKPRYFGTFSKLHELTDRIKFPIPEFDKLGAQPLFAHEVNPLFLLNGDTSYEEAPEYIVSRIGWQNRYAEFKEKFNRCSYLYADLGKFFNIQNLDPAPPSPSPEIGDNIYAPWLISRTAFFLQNQTLNPSTQVNGYEFFEWPDALDNVMVNTYQTSWDSVWEKEPHLILQSDPILTEFFAKVKKVSWMSPTGEPDM